MVRGGPKLYKAGGNVAHERPNAARFSTSDPSLLSLNPGSALDIVPAVFVES